MKRAILCVFVVATTTTAARAQSYTNTTTIDNNVKTGNLCNLDCKMAWSTGVTAVTAGTVIVTQPDGTTFTPDYTATYISRDKTFEFVGSFSGNQIGTYTLTFKGKSSVVIR